MAVPLDSMQVVTEPGEHPGWTRHWFSHNGWQWKLLTIDDNDPRSLLGPEDRSRVPRPPAGLAYMQPFHGIITVAVARQIIGMAIDAHNQGIKEGRQQTRDELRKALGVS